MPQGHHRRRERPWTPAEYLTLIGERVADAELGFTPGVAGQKIVPRTSLPQVDSALPSPLTEAEDGHHLREVIAEELQGSNRTRLMSHVYGAETSSHQRRLALCFDSRDWKTWTGFQNEFRTLAGREGWTALQCLNQLRSRLSGQTAATVNRVEFVCGRMTSYEDLSAVCQYHVLGETAVTDSRSQLQSRTRGPDENIRAYAYALLDLAQLAYPGTGNDHVHKACERFISTVTKSANIKRMLYQNFVGNPTPSIEALASIAIKAERSEELVDLELGNDSTSVIPTDKPTIRIQSNPESKESISVQEINSTDLPELIAAMRRFPRSRDGSRHKSRRDRTRSSSRPSRSSSRHSRDRHQSRENHSQTKAREHDLCFKCGGKGHYASSCPSPDTVRQDRKKKYEEKSLRFKSKKSDNKSNKRPSSKGRKYKRDIMKQVVDTVIAYSNATSETECSDEEAQ